MVSLLHWQCGLQLRRVSTEKLHPSQSSRLHWRANRRESTCPPGRTSWSDGVWSVLCICSILCSSCFSGITKDAHVQPISQSTHSWRPGRGSRTEVLWISRYSSFRPFVCKSAWCWGKDILRWRTSNNGEAFTECAGRKRTMNWKRLIWTKTQTSWGYQSILERHGRRQSSYRAYVGDTTKVKFSLCRKFFSIFIHGNLHSTSTSRPTHISLAKTSPRPPV